MTSYIGKSGHGHAHMKRREVMEKDGKDRHKAFKTIISTIILNLLAYKHRSLYGYSKCSAVTNHNANNEYFITVIIDLCKPLYLITLMKILSRQLIDNRTLECSLFNPGSKFDM